MVNAQTLRLDRTKKLPLFSCVTWALYLTSLGLHFLTYKIELV